MLLRSGVRCLNFVSVFSERNWRPRLWKTCSYDRANHIFCQNQLTNFYQCIYLLLVYHTEEPYALMKNGLFVSNEKANPHHHMNICNCFVLIYNYYTISVTLSARHLADNYWNYLIIRTIYRSFWITSSCYRWDFDPYINSGAFVFLADDVLYVMWVRKDSGRRTLSFFSWIVSVHTSTTNQNKTDITYFRGNVECKG